MKSVSVLNIALAQDFTLIFRDQMLREEHITYCDDDMLQEFVNQYEFENYTGACRFDYFLDGNRRLTPSDLCRTPQSVSRL